MKNFFKSTLAIALALLGLAAEAQQPVQPLLYGLTNTTTLTIATGGAVITTDANSNYNTTTFPIWRDRGFVLHIASIGASGSATGSAGCTLQLATPHSSTNGASTAGPLVTNWDNALSFTWTSTGTTEVFYSTNVPKVITDNYTIGRLLSATNGSTVSISLDPTNTFVSATP